MYPESVKDCIISCYNHPTGVDYIAEALIFKMATCNVLMFLRLKIKENAVALIIT